MRNVVSASPRGKESRASLQPGADNLGISNAQERPVMRSIGLRMWRRMPPGWTVTMAPSRIMSQSAPAFSGH